MNPIADLVEPTSEDINSVVGDEITPEISNEELVKIITHDLEANSSSFSELIKIAEQNESYWAGNQIDKHRLKSGDAPVHVNRILVAQETIIPIITQEVPPPMIVVTPKSKKGKKLESKLSRHLRDLWDYYVNMQFKMEVVLRNYLNSRVGFLKVRYDEDKKTICTDNVRLSRLRFDVRATSVEHSRFVAEYVTETIADVIRRFPGAKKALMSESLRAPLGTRSEMTYVEYWGTYVSEDNKVVSYVCWKYKNTLLGKDFNPYWNKTGSNHFMYPKKPYIPLNSLSLGKSMVDDTSITEQAIPLQDILNKRKRQIDRNANFANGIMVTTAAAMDKPTFEGINPGTSKVYLNSDVENIDGAFRVVTGRAMESGIFQDMQDTKNEIDNLYGAHATLRGERTAFETKGGRELLKEGSLGRQEILRRSYEQVAEEVYNWWVQLMYVFYTEPQDIITEEESRNPGNEQKKMENIIDPNEDKLSKKDFKGFKIKCIVKAGTTRPKDPETLRADAITIRQTGNMNPLTFFEMMGVDNPRQEARREYLWQQPELRSMMFPEVQGEFTIDPIAIMHIKDMNSGMMEAEDTLIDTADIETIRKHIATHNMYVRGIDIDENLEPFENLPVWVQEMHKSHISMEKGILQKQSEKMQDEQAQMQGGIEGQALEQAQMGGQMAAQPEQEQAV